MNTHSREPLGTRYAVDWGVSAPLAAPRQKFLLIRPPLEAHEVDVEAVAMSFSHAWESGRQSKLR